MPVMITKNRIAIVAMPLIIPCRYAEENSVETIVKAPERGHYSLYSGV